MPDVKHMKWWGWGVKGWRSTTRTSLPFGRS